MAFNLPPEGIKNARKAMERADKAAAEWGEFWNADIINGGWDALTSEEFLGAVRCVELASGLQLPEERWHWRPEVDAKAVAHAAASLGIVGSVYVDWADFGEDDIDAYYRREPDHHLIVINRNRTPREASRAIWHELTHALQCEKLYDSDAERYHDAVFDAAVDGDEQFEIPARMAELHDYDRRLVRMEKRGP